MHWGGDQALAQGVQGSGEQPWKCPEGCGRGTRGRGLVVTTGWKVHLGGVSHFLNDSVVL